MCSGRLQPSMMKFNWRAKDLRYLKGKIYENLDLSLPLEINPV
jgi:hypothetical protein